MPNAEQLDSMSNDIRDITEGIEGAVGNLTDAAGEIVDGNADSSPLADLAEKIVGDNADVAFDIESDKTNESKKTSGQYCYAYSKLSRSEQVLYNEVYDILTNMREETSISSEKEDELDTSFKAVLADHPEIFWVDGYNVTKYTVGDQVTDIKMCGQYNCSPEEKDALIKEIDEATDNILKHIDNNASNYELVKAVYDYIILNTEYDLSSKYNQDIRSVILHGRSVCQGYAKATQYLLNKLGVDTSLVTGKALGEGHAWNLVKVDGEYYYLDTTWGDASYTSEISGDYNGRIPDINYEYFLVTTDIIKETHKIGDKWEYPKCTSNVSNYYIKEGLYFTSVDNTQLENVFDRALDKQQEYVSLKCSSKECYEAMVEYLIDDQEVFKYVSDAKTLSYAISDESLSIIIWLI